MARPRNPTSSPIELDLSAALDHERGVGRADLLLLAPRLEQARQTLIDEAANDTSHWLNWPRRLLEDHQAQRHRGLLTRWLTAAKHFRHTVDRAVILGPPDSIAVLKAIFAACCHPYHNELPRAERGGRPRIYFVSTKSDNDALQGLFDIMPQGRRLHLEEERWGIVALDDGRGSDLLTAIFKVLWDALLGTTEAGEEAERAMVVGPAGSPLMEFAEVANCPRLPFFSLLPLAGEGAEVRGEAIADGEQKGSGVGAAKTPSVCKEPFPHRLPTPADAATLVDSHVYNPGILLAAAVMNVDVVQFLLGAVTVTDAFRTSPVGNNLALDFAGCSHLLAERRGIRGWSIDCPAELKSLAHWWRGLASCEADSQLLIQWQPTSVRRDRVRVTMPAGEAPSGRKKTIDRYLPDASSAAAELVRSERTANGLPTAVVRLPTVDESTVGQLLQLRMIADQCTLHAPS